MKNCPILTAIYLLLAACVHAQSSYSSSNIIALEQSPARPLGLDIINEVQADLQDARYSAFKNEKLDAILANLKAITQERELIDASTENLSLEDLYLPQSSEVRVYYLRKGTVFHNTLAFETNEDRFLILPNASFEGSTSNQKRPLTPGDYVDLGRLPAGSYIDLFLIKDGARDEAGEVYWTNVTKNRDKTHHLKLLLDYGNEMPLVGFEDVFFENKTLIIGFEDLPGGGDRDFNDLVIAVEIVPLA